MYLLDTNIWLERLLEQERAEEVKNFFDEVSANKLSISDFAFHSICVIMDNLDELGLLENFINDLFLENNVNIINIEPKNINTVNQIIDKYNLDFDDAYQYVAAKEYNLKLISFDSDFDKTERGKKTPRQILSNR